MNKITKICFMLKQKNYCWSGYSMIFLNCINTEPEYLLQLYFLNHDVNRDNYQILLTGMFSFLGIGPGGADDLCFHTWRNFSFSFMSIPAPLAFSLETQIPALRPKS